MKTQTTNLGKVAITVEKDYWNINKEYDKLVVVEVENGYRSYISRKAVPIGTSLNDRDYWIPFSKLPEQNFNMYFTTYTRDKETTRLQVPIHLRRKGLYLTYVVNDKVITEWYNGNDTNDEAFIKDINWMYGSNMLVGDITISSDGYWIINGEKTDTKAQGEKGEKPILRANIYTGYLEYSYDNINWYNLISFSDLTPDIQIGTIETLSAGNKVSITKSGNNVKPVLNFKIPMGNTGAKGDKGDGWKLNGWVDTIDDLPSNANFGDTYLVGTTIPYKTYIWKNNNIKWVEVGSINELKSEVFDGGRADTVYGGSRTINCGGAADINV